MIKYIHIGYPKTLTSSLQSNFFPKHSQVLHLGLGCDSPLDYIDDAVNIALENYIMYAKDFPYIEYEEEIKSTFNKWFEYAERKGYKAVGISLESLSFNYYPNQNDTVVIAKRLQRIFGQDTRIIALIRNQLDLIKSLYGQYVREGLPLDYKGFIDYIYMNKERNFLYDFLYDKMFFLYADLFGIENVHFIPLEAVRDFKTKKLFQNNEKIILLETISNILNIDYERLDIGHANASLSKKELFQKLQLNREIRHELGNLIFEHASIHRNRKYFEQDPLIKITDLFFDVKKKRLLLEEAKKLSVHDPREMNYFADPEILKRLSKKFIHSNKTLTQDFEVKLPNIYFQPGM